ncbi:MAG: amidohydrolase family protein [Desulfobacterota bacterium]|nr:amidohydrolase family protein [Thermodesulfobacteriota bacterium]
MIIDIHNHLSPKGSPYCLPAEEYLSIMDELDVEKAVILGKDYGQLGDRQCSNLPDEEVASFVKAHPDRFIGFTAVHPDRATEANLERIDRAVTELGLRGIKLNPASGFYPNDKRLYPIYEKASALRIPIVIHMGLKPPAEGNRLKYCLPVYLDDVAVDFPELTIVVAHAAYPWVDDLIMAALYAPNVFVDISTLNQVEEVLGYPVVLPTLAKIVKALGAGRVVFGSDGIFNIQPLIAAVRRADFLTDSDRTKILRENALKILRLTQ